MERIAFQGERGAFSEEAARRLFGEAVEVLPRASFEEVFQAVADGTADAAVLPVENSIAGSIHRNYDLLLERDLPIVGEVEVRVSHCLIAHPGVELTAIRRVYSHPQALAQCEAYLRGLGIETVASYDTAGSVKLIRDQQIRDGAAIASARAAEIYGMAVLASEIEDLRENYTRFVAISRQAAPLGPRTKSSIVFSLPNAPGSLFKALSVFALRDIDLLKIESRPLRGRRWHYLFYVDFAGDAADAGPCQRALEHLGEFADFIKVLGTYPRWTQTS